jgi:hypothetical protein
MLPFKTALLETWTAHGLEIDSGIDLGIDLERETESAKVM